MIIEAAKTCNMKQSKINYNSNLTPWFDKECTKTKNSIRDLGIKLKQNPRNEDIRTELFNVKKKFQKLIRNKKRTYKKTIINKMSNSYQDQKSFWKLLKKLDKPKTNYVKYVSHTSFHNHFKNILNSKRIVNIPPDNHEEGKLDYEFTVTELKAASNLLKDGKATGMDNLSNEMIKCFTDVYPLLTIKLFNDVLTTNKAIPDWTTAMIIPIHKKGSLSNPDNYRGISLLSCLGKLFMAMLNNRLLNYALSNKILSPNQLGFLPGNRISDAHLIIHNLIRKQCHNNNARIYSCFVGFSKAFDTIPRDKLLNKLLKYDIKGNFFNTIKNIYCNDEACIKISNNEITENFNINQGVKQGCILSPLLFNIYLSDLPKILDEDLTNTNPNATHPSCLLWADDIIMLSENEEGLNEMLKSLGGYCKENELTLNVNKTRFLI